MIRNVKSQSIDQLSTKIRPKRTINLIELDGSGIYTYNKNIYVNTNEIPGELLRENLISSHVKVTCYLHM